MRKSSGGGTKAGIGKADLSCPLTMGVLLIGCDGCPVNWVFMGVLLIGYNPCGCFKGDVVRGTRNGVHQRPEMIKPFQSRA